VFHQRPMAIEDQLTVLGSAKVMKSELVLVMRSTGSHEKVDFIELYERAPSYNSNGEIDPPALQSDYVEYKLDSTGRPSNSIASAEIDTAKSAILVRFDDGHLQVIPIGPRK
jgi:hypothetical protein